MGRWWGRVWLTVAMGAIVGRQLGAQPDSTYRDHITAAQAASAAGNDTLARRHLIRALDLIHGHPDLYYLIARTEVRLRHPEAAVARLRTIAAMGLNYDAGRDSAFAPIRGRPDFAAVLRTMRHNDAPVGQSTVAFSFADTNLLTEDIAYDPVARMFYVSSIHRREILAVPMQGAMTEFATADRDTLDGVMALAVDAPRRRLWATTATAPQAEGHRSGAPTRGAVLRYDLGTGHLMKRYPLPDDGLDHEPGDMTLDAAGSAVIADGLSGVVYAIPAATDSLIVLIGHGIFRSPQTPAVLPDGRILIADYALGIASIDPLSHAVTWLGHSDSVAYSGIDGMYLVGHSLLAIQNGTPNPRIVTFQLDSSYRRIQSWSVVEQSTPHLGQPTHGAVVGDTLYFIGNSGWDRFEDDGTIKPDPHATPPVILRTTLVAHGQQIR